MPMIAAPVISSQSMSERQLDREHPGPHRPEGRGGEHLRPLDREKLQRHIRPGRGLERDVRKG